jgi:hypothetical protein
MFDSNRRNAFNGNSTPIITGVYCEYPGNVIKLLNCDPIFASIIDTNDVTRKGVVWGVQNLPPPEIPKF